MPLERCPKCGKFLTQESRDACTCADRPATPAERGLDGARFVKTILAIAGVVALISMGLFHAIAYLRTLHGLSGFHR